MKNTKEYLLGERKNFNKVATNPALLYMQANEGEVSLEDLSKEVSLENFIWFFAEHHNLTVLEKQRFALFLAKSVLPLFETNHPNDNTVKNCLTNARDFLNSKVSRWVAMDARNATFRIADKVALEEKADTYTESKAAMSAIATAHASAYAVAANAHTIGNAVSIVAIYVLPVASSETKKTIMNYILNHK